MKKLILLLALVATTAVSAQSDMTFEEYGVNTTSIVIDGVKPGGLHFIRQIKIVDVNGTLLLFLPKETLTFKNGRRGMQTNSNEHGEYYILKNGKLQSWDSDGRLDPEYVIIERVAL